MVVSMVYYGLSLNTGNLGGDFYINFTISGLVEFPAYTLCLLLLDRIGRKWLHCSTMVLGGLACISTVLTTIYGGDGKPHSNFAKFDFTSDSWIINYLKNVTIKARHRSTGGYSFKRIALEVLV